MTVSEPALLRSRPCEVEVLLKFSFICSVRGLEEMHAVGRIMDLIHVATVSAKDVLADLLLGRMTACMCTTTDQAEQ